MTVVRLLFLTIRDVARSRARLQVELLAVRVVVEPATVVAWHRRGVRLFWT
jgi:hypothetical protein